MVVTQTFANLFQYFQTFSVFEHVELNSSFSKKRPCGHVNEHQGFMQLLNQYRLKVLKTQSLD